MSRPLEAVMAKIQENPVAAEALDIKSPLIAAASGSVPDLTQGRP